RPKAARRAGAKRASETRKGLRNAGTTRIFALLLLALLAIVGCRTGAPARRGGLPEAQVKAMPPDVEAAYRVFAVKCSRCHTLSRPLNAAIYDPNHWESYVARMRRQAGSGISKRDAEVILVFLRYYSEQQAVQEGLRPAATATVSGGAG
ncbi:MAG: hypothetical protein KC933_24540, partial [Myxococcales bacterium]|nr:hypothetical protein [Myxococcales bacterium]